jgi:8-oxo-dGTP diphosphatase
MPRIDQGVSNDRYCVIPRVLIFIFREDKVLLIKGSPTKRIWPGRYNGIGGHIEQGEDVLSAARRELWEETGINCDSLALCGTVMVDIGEKRGISLYIYKGDYPLGDIRDSTEGTLEWVEVDMVNHHELVEDLTVILPRIYSSKSEDAPFSARYYYDNDEKLCIEFGE